MGVPKGYTAIPESLSVKRAIFTDKLMSNGGLSVGKRFNADKLPSEGYFPQKLVFLRTNGSGE